MSPPRLAVLALACLSLTACGKELGRAPFTGPGTQTITATLAAGDVALWTDLDLEWTGDAALQYEVDLLQGGKKVASTTCQPLAYLPAKLGFRETNLGGSHTRAGAGKMTCRASVPASGPTTVNVTLTVTKAPATIRFGKVDLVLKQ